MPQRGERVNFLRVKNEIDCLNFDKEAALETEKQIRYGKYRVKVMTHLRLTDPFQERPGGLLQEIKNKNLKEEYLQSPNKRK